METRKKIEWIDVSKGILIILVILGHISFEKNINHGDILEPSVFVANTWKLITDWIYSCHIPGFFIINGILKSRTKFDEKENTLIQVLKKQKKVATYYYVFSLIFFVRYVAQMIVGINSFDDIILFACNTILLVGMAALWFLPAFFLSQIIFFYWLKNRVTKISVFVLLVLSLIATKTMDVHGIQDSWCFVSKVVGVASRSMIASSFVIIGFCLDKARMFDTKFWGVSILTVLFFLNGGSDLNMLNLNNILLYYIFAVLGTMFVINVAKGIVKVGGVYFAYSNIVVRVLSLLCVHIPFYWYYRPANL